MPTSFWKILLIIMIVVMLILMACCGYACWLALQPKVHPVGSVADPTIRYNILYLGDGFTSADELNTYRAAVEQLTEGLLEQAPFCHHKERLNFYRIDVEDPYAEIDETNCPAGTVRLQAMEPMPFSTTSTPVSGSRDLVKENLRATRCWTGVTGMTGDEDVLWIDDTGLMRAHLLAILAPSISVVVVIANTQEKYGAGLWDVWPASIGTVVLGLPQDKDSSGRWRVSDDGKAFFAHELGHGLGLLDEYPYPGLATLDPGTDRNVWHPATTAAIPWKAALPSGCNISSMLTCCGYFDFATTTKQVCDPASTACAMVPGVCQKPSVICSSPWNTIDPLACSVPPSCNPPVSDPDDLQWHKDCDGQAGAWEGANYQALGYYRSRRNCRMLESYMEVPFCDACALYIAGLLCRYGDTTLPCPNYADTMSSCPP